MLLVVVMLLSYYDSYDYWFHSHHYHYYYDDYYYDYDCYDYWFYYYHHHYYNSLLKFWSCIPCTTLSKRINLILEQYFSRCQFCNCNFAVFCHHYHWYRAEVAEVELSVLVAKLKPYVWFSLAFLRLPFLSLIQLYCSPRIFASLTVLIYMLVLRHNAFHGSDHAQPPGTGTGRGRIHWALGNQVWYMSINLLWL
jgi:hypothetical protein